MFTTNNTSLTRNIGVSVLALVAMLLVLLSVTATARAESSPLVLDTRASATTPTTATLAGYVNPNGSATSYRFEWGTTMSYGNQAPADFTPFIGAGTQPLSVPVQIGGLQPGTTYHFRLTATSTAGIATGLDETFSTPSTSACRNEALRSENNSDALPDCRAYERVTPQSKGGVQTSATVVPGDGTTNIASIAPSGEDVLAITPAIWGQPPGYTPLSSDPGTPAQYELSRTGVEWSVTPLNPPASSFGVADPRFAGEAEPGSGVWATRTNQQPENAGNLYVRSADGAFTNIGPIAPEAATAGEPGTAGFGASFKVLQVVGASRDLDRVLFLDRARAFEGKGFEWPGDETQLSLTGTASSLYEYVGTGHTGSGGDVPTLVGIDNAGAQISQCGTLLGAKAFGTAQTGTAQNAVSTSGATVIFSAKAGGCTRFNPETEEVEVGTGPASTQLFARIGEPGQGTEMGHATTVNVAGSTECATSDSCNVTEAITYQGAASDGSKMFFTTDQALTSADKDSTSDLYECELPGDGGATPTPVSKVNPCPSLLDLSSGGTGDATPGEGASVQKVVAVSEDGSHVYFTAQGVLTTTANNQGRVAEAGEENLYVVNTQTRETAFVATLPTSPLEAQTTPNGRYLVFTSTGDLTLDDTSTAAQVFRYDAQTEQLVRVSVGQDGFNDNGNTSTEPATLALHSTMSDDGAYVVFQSNLALTPQIQGGTQNVYLWHEGVVSLISDGHAQEKVEREQGLVGIDASGQNIFFVTPAPLVPQDKDELSDLYDARINGGFPAPAAEPSCSGEGCQGPSPAASTPPSPGSTGPATTGNLTAAPFKETPEPGAKPKSKPLTSAQKLANALKACRRTRSKSRRQACEKAARRRYAPKPKAKKK